MVIKTYNQIIIVTLLLLSYLHLPACGNGITSHSNVKCIEQERQALLKFKHGIDADPCGMLSSWGDQEGGNNENCCQWRGVGCSNRTGHVIMLDLGKDQQNSNSSIGCGLEGNLDPSLHVLKHLKFLELSFNSFGYKPIPGFIGSFVNLRHLNISNAGFTGEVPHQLGNLSRLTSLGLSSLEFVVDDWRPLSAKSLTWLSRLSLLEYVDLSGIDLRRALDWFQIVNTLPVLRVLHMGGCSLSPTISGPLSYVNSSTTLRTIQLRDNFNDSSTSIFQWLFNLSGINTHLMDVDLSQNSLSGAIPSAFGNLHALSYLDLSDNAFEGVIPSTFGNMRSLSHLDLSENRLEGHIPDNISNLTSLKYVYLSYNNFLGILRMPGKLCSLQELDFGSNNITDDFTNIIKTFSGCASRSLVHLDLSLNQISGEVPDKMGTFSSLRELDLYGNKLNGTVSPTVGQLSLLETLDLSSNSLTGTLHETHLSNLSRLTPLELSNNPMLLVKISANWTPPFQLDFIGLSSCMLGSQSGFKAKQTTLG